MGTRASITSTDRTAPSAKPRRCGLYPTNSSTSRHSASADATAPQGSSTNTSTSHRLPAPSASSDSYCPDGGSTPAADTAYQGRVRGCGGTQPDRAAQEQDRHSRAPLSFLEQTRQQEQTTDLAGCLFWSGWGVVGRWGAGELSVCLVDAVEGGLVV